MIDPLSTIASYLANSLWQVPLVAAAGWAVSRLLKKLGPQIEHVTWVLTLILAVLTPALPILRNLPHIWTRDNSRTLSSITIAVQNSTQHASVAMKLPQTFLLVVLALYAITLLYFATRLLWSLYWTNALLREASPVALTQENDLLWQRCKQAFSIEDACIFSSQCITGPVTLGLGLPILLLPPDLEEECTPHDLIAALSHESAHMQRCDFQKNLFYEVASLVIAFHPITWMLKSQIAQTREMVCDDMAIHKLVDPETYSRSLLRLATIVALASRTSAYHAIGIFDADILEKRLMSMYANKRHVSFVRRFGLILSGALVLFGAVSVVAVRAVAVEVKTPLEVSETAAPFRTVETGAAPESTTAIPDKAAAAPMQGQTRTADVRHIGGNIRPPEIIRQVEPEYSEEARAAKAAGNVQVGLIVDRQGRPTNVHVIQGVGMGLDEEALDAVKQYRFKPATEKGKPVSVDMKVEVNFQIF